MNTVSRQSSIHFYSDMETASTVTSWMEIHKHVIHLVELQHHAKTLIVARSKPLSAFSRLFTSSHIQV